MAISVDTVYQTVQRILNIEQRGQLPPNDFNHFADLAQKDMFNAMFYNDAHFMLNPKKVNTELRQMMEQQKDVFVDYFTSMKSDAVPGRANVWSLPDNLHTIIQIYYQPNSGDRVIVEQIDHKTARYIINSRLTEPTALFPKYERYYNSGDGIGTISLLPDSITSGVLIEYYRVPAIPEWNSVIVQGTPIFNQTSSTDFELHVSMQDDLIMKILLLAGVSTRQEDIAAFAQQQMGVEMQQEKQ